MLDNRSPIYALQMVLALFETFAMHLLGPTMSETNLPPHRWASAAEGSVANRGADPGSHRSRCPCQAAWRSTAMEGAGVARTCCSRRARLSSLSHSTASGCRVLKVNMPEQKLHATRRVETTGPRGGTSGPERSSPQGHCNSTDTATTDG